MGDTITLMKVRRLGSGPCLVLEDSLDSNALVVGFLVARVPWVLLYGSARDLAQIRLVTISYV